jgi:deltex-like protein
MKATLCNSTICDGFKQGTIIIDYYFPSTKLYSGTRRYAYLPNTTEGREVLGLLKVCFDRRLTFTVGTSVTTGESNTTVWNGVHHKTNTTGGSQYFGYPDTTYFNRVKQELAAKGVTQENINENLQDIANKLIDYTMENETNLNSKVSNKKGKK